MQRWVLASSNPGKLREFEHALGDELRSHEIELVNQSILGVASAEEPHDTFEENALAKARHASRTTGLPALADDSGICVAALGGAPGVRSARYWEDALACGPTDASAQGPAVTAEELKAFDHEHRNHSADEHNLHWLIARMIKTRQARYAASDAPDAFWDAAFVTVISLVRHADDANPIFVTGRWNGKIVLTPQGANGFGYDPIFFDRRLGRTGAQLSLKEKEQVSHRGAALKLLRESLPEVLRRASR